MPFQIGHPSFPNDLHLKAATFFVFLLLTREPQVTHFHLIVALFVLFSAVPSFVFDGLEPPFQNTGGGWASLLGHFPAQYSLLHRPVFSTACCLGGQSLVWTRHARRRTL